MGFNGIMRFYENIVRFNGIVVGFNWTIVGFSMGLNGIGYFFGFMVMRINRGLIDRVSEGDL